MHHPSLSQSHLPAEAVGRRARSIHLFNAVACYYEPLDVRQGLPRGQRNLAHNFGIEPAKLSPRLGIIEIMRRQLVLMGEALQLVAQPAKGDYL